MSVNPLAPNSQGLPIAEHLGHCCNALTAFVVPLLLAAAISLTIYYAVHPVAPLVPIYGDFSLSLPLLICGSAGVALTITLIVQIACRKKVTKSCGFCVSPLVQSNPKVQEKIRTLVHPGGRPTDQTIKQYKIDNADFIQEVVKAGGEEVTFPTRDGIHLGGYLYRAKHDSARWVIFFHGNNMNAEDLNWWCHVYKERCHFNVLSVEFRGYGISEGIAAGPNAEMEAYYDAEAALQFARSQGVNTSRIIAHGYSLGGAYAAALGHFFHIPYVILQNTFVDLTHVATHFSKVVPDTLIAPSMGYMFQQGSALPLPQFPDGLPLQTDNFNNLGKVEKMQGEVFVIHSMNDHLICADTGRKLVEARYPDKETQDKHLITLEDGHDMYALFADHNVEYWEQFWQFLCSITEKDYTYALEKMFESIRGIKMEWDKDKQKYGIGEQEYLASE